MISIVVEDDYVVSKPDPPAEPKKPTGVPCKPALPVASPVALTTSMNAEPVRSESSQGSVYGSDSVDSFLEPIIAEGKQDIVQTQQVLDSVKSTGVETNEADVEMGHGARESKKRSIGESKAEVKPEGMGSFAGYNNPLQIACRLSPQSQAYLKQLPQDQWQAILETYLNSQLARLPSLHRSIVVSQPSTLHAFDKLVDILTGNGLQLDEIENALR